MEIKGGQIKKDLIKDLLEKREIVEKLSFLLIGNPNNPSSMSYIGMIKKLLDTLSIPYKEHYIDDGNIAKKIILKDKTSTSIVVARPLNVPNEDKIYELIPPHKDCDMLTSSNAGKLFRGDLRYLPATAKAVKILVEKYNIRVDGKKVLIIGRSVSVGLPLFYYFQKMNGTVTLAHSHTSHEELVNLSLNSDIIVLASGQRLLKPEDIPSGATIIDCGYQDDGKGDLGFIPTENDFTPVPGGVGPLTIISLVLNAVDLFLEHQD